jgi:hypothetical protein
MRDAQAPAAAGDDLIVAWTDLPSGNVAVHRSSSACMTETTIAPPSYDGFGYEALISSSHAAPSDLPVYTRRPTPPPALAPVEREAKEFTYEAKNRGGTPWATLTVKGDPRLTKAIPTVMQGSDLVGSVKLALRSAEAIQAVCILVSGWC